MCFFYQNTHIILFRLLFPQKRNIQRGVYSHLKTNIVIISLLFVFHKAAKNFKTVIEGLYKEINIACFLDRILGNWTCELMQNTQSILNGLTWTKNLHNVHIHSIIKHVCFTYKGLFRSELADKKSYLRGVFSCRSLAQVDGKRIIYFGCDMQNSPIIFVRKFALNRP